MLTSCHVQGVPPPTPHSSSPPPSFWLALDWTHVGQPELPLAVKLFNWSLIGCDCSALGARCRPCFLTLQAKVMIPTAAPASALPLFAGRSHFIFCFAPSAKWILAFHSCHLPPPSLPPLALLSQFTCLPLNLNDERARSPFSLAALLPSLSPFPFPLPFPWWCCANCTLTPNSSERFQQSRANLQREIT